MFPGIGNSVACQPLRSASLAPKSSARRGGPVVCDPPSTPPARSASPTRGSGLVVLSAFPCPLLGPSAPPRLLCPCALPFAARPFPVSRALFIPPLCSPRRLPRPWAAVLGLHPLRLAVPRRVLPSPAALGLPPSPTHVSSRSQAAASGSSAGPSRAGPSAPPPLPFGLPRVGGTPSSAILPAPRSAGPRPFAPCAPPLPQYQKPTADPNPRKCFRPR